MQDASQRGLSLTVGEDPRITRSGRILRKYKLDELPQLLNVIMGDMSLVGPRPEVPYYVEMYSREQRQVLDLMPGITDPASIKFRNESEMLAAVEADGNEINDPEKYYVNIIMPEKININLEYAKGSSIKSDFVVILKTLFGFDYA